MQQGIRIAVLVCIQNTVRILYYSHIANLCHTSDAKSSGMFETRYYLTHKLPKKYITYQMKTSKGSTTLLLLQISLRLLYDSGKNIRFT